MVSISSATMRIQKPARGKSGETGGLRAGAAPDAGGGPADGAAAAAGSGAKAAGSAEKGAGASAAAALCIVGSGAGAAVGGALHWGAPPFATRCARTDRIRV